jgi:hypothetical protein
LFFDHRVHPLGTGTGLILYVYSCETLACQVLMTIVN